MELSPSRQEGVARPTDLRPSVLSTRPGPSGWTVRWELERPHAQLAQVAAGAQPLCQPCQTSGLLTRGSNPLAEASDVGP